MKEIECGKCATKFDYEEGLAECPRCGHVTYVEDDCDDPENCRKCNPASFA